MLKKGGIKKAADTSRKAQSLYDDMHKISGSKHHLKAPERIESLFSDIKRGIGKG
ncbi:MAG: hypothetical protein ABIC95_00320 [archaeon]